MVKENKDISSKAAKMARSEAPLSIAHHALTPLPLLMSYGKINY